MTTAELAPCPECRKKDRWIEKLERDLAEAAHGVDVMTRQWLEAKEAKEKK